ncbi:MAG: endonuclease/exonuclease/phosphatase family protein [Planctomycetota bacterium]
MWRIILVTTVAALGVGGWYTAANYSLEVHRSAEGKFQYVRIVPRAASGSVPSESAADQPPAAPTRPAIRLATFNLNGLDDNRLSNPKVCDNLVRILSRFDVVALQHIRAGNHGMLMRLKDQINATGRCFDFVTCPTLDRDPTDVYNAMLFDATTVEVDHSTVHSVDAPLGTFRVRPLMAEFRVRGPPPSEAFTFTLVNVLVDPRRVPQELDALAHVYRAARDSGHGEDDIIMLGDFESDPEHLGRLGHVPGIIAAVNGVPTTTRGTRLADNILFDRRATVEYTGRAGVLDMIRELDLTPQEALDISEHLPVWAEFSSYENGQASHVN